MAKVIRRWINDNGRWNSPKYLGGESYGTTRTAMVVRELEGATYNDVGLNGLILISTILDFAAREPTPGNEMAYVMALPNMATAAYYHGKAEAPSVEAIAEQARRFAIGPYATALLKGQDLPQAERVRGLKLAQHGFHIGAELRLGCGVRRNLRWRELLRQHLGVALGQVFFVVGLRLRGSSCVWLWLFGGGPVSGVLLHRVLSGLVPGGWTRTHPTTVLVRRTVVTTYYFWR